MYLNIALVGIEVVVGLFGHGEGEDHDEGTDVCDKEADSENLDELCKGIDEEEHVKEEFKLVVEHFGDECEDVILGVFDDVVLVVEGINLTVEADVSLGNLDVFAAVLFEPFKLGGLGGFIGFGFLLEEVLLELGGAFVCIIHPALVKRLLLHS